MAGGRGEAEIRTNEPVIEVGKVLSLIPQIKSNVIKKDRVGLNDGT